MCVRFVKSNAKLHLLMIPFIFVFFSLSSEKLAEGKGRISASSSCCCVVPFALRFPNSIDKIRRRLDAVQMNHAIISLLHVTQTLRLLAVLRHRIAPSKWNWLLFFVSFLFRSFCVVTKRSPTFMLEFICKWPTYDAWLTIQRTIYVSKIVYYCFKS